MTDDEGKICCNFGTLVAEMLKNPASAADAAQLLAEHPDLLKPRKAYKKYQKALLQLHIPYHVVLSRKINQLYMSAQRRGKDFNLTLQDVDVLLKTPTCFYTGVELTTMPGPYQRTVDRVDNNKGYVKGNVVACSNLANNIKNQLFESPTSDIRTNIEFMVKLISKLRTIYTK